MSRENENGCPRLPLYLICSFSLAHSSYLRKHLGIIGLVISFLISLFSSLGKDSALITTVAGFIMAVLYTICAGLLTFENGPATYVGNHYFSAWAGFFVSFAVFGTVLKEFLGVGGREAAAASGGAESGGELRSFGAIPPTSVMYTANTAACFFPSKTKKWIQFKLIVRWLVRDVNFLLFWTSSPDMGISPISGVAGWLRHAYLKISFLSRFYQVVYQ